MQNDALFFSAILLFFFILWFATGGPSKPISFAGPFITPVTNVGVHQEGYGPGGTAATNSPQYQQTVKSELTSISEKIARLRTQISTIQQFGPASPYKGQVIIEKSSSGPAGTSIEKEYVTIRAAYNASADVSLSGWSLVSAATGATAKIPQATRTFSYGEVNATAPIVLHPGESVLISTGESPLGVSFKENMCLGYLTDRQSFYPSIQNRCPTPLKEFEQYYTGNALRDDACYALVRETSICKTPSEGDRLSSSCFSFIDKRLTYSGCVLTHRYDPSFEGTKWYAYLNRTEITRFHKDTDDYGELWKQSREGIKLLDAEGKTVDEFIY